MFRAITTDVAHLTKKFGGSFSGEHGDGIVRAEFIPLMVGEQNYALFKRIKGYFDPKGILNPGKIVDPYPMDAALRYEVAREEPNIETLLDFSDSEGILKAAEKCNGSGDCRKTHHMSGAMCPSYHATKNEKDTTRGRANALREFLTHPTNGNAFDRPELKEVFDLCLSCKACGSECPSNVDVATLKAEFSYQYQEANGYSMRSRLFAHNTKLNQLASYVAPLTNAVYRSSVLGGLLKKAAGIAPQRSFPKVHRFDFKSYLKNAARQEPKNDKRLVLYIDEFTRYLDVDLGKDAISLLSTLGYSITLYFAESGRTYLSKGYLKQAKALAEGNMPKLKEFAEKGLPVVGLEPSAILTFRDEYKRLVSNAEAVEQVAANVF